MIFLQFYQFLHYFGVWLLGKYKFKYFPGELNPYFLYFEVILFISRNAFDFQFSSVHFSSSVVSDSCDSIDCSTPGLPVHHQLLEFTQNHVHWVGDAIQPSHPVIHFSPCLQSFPASGSFQMNQSFASGGQSIGVSASTSILPMNTQDWSPLGWTGWISWQSKKLSRVFSNTTVQKNQFFGAQPSSQSNSQQPYMTTGKTIALTRRTFVGKVMSLLLNILSRLVVTFLEVSIV